ncbi:glutamate-1-semialdehyde 2,1-aminomutase [Gonapodya prolifera JEL478]|uniref:Glutamate-1-semialdehyde 2,1-aminomutase n=1 Tax=Gonapodya prolifera (strain JEL478) TaxID=1344416 RepID=A0A139A2C7_GONPJ|nr:glutamate-1-semialdehyde 2,1-aminomutase [Gonapodya prolifera JEL478]|eukprot:KXS10849.1 glutamate-1-semialdehyde 2,1-aminomutase [Gonapodya prolifera JEL478]
MSLDATLRKDTDAVIPGGLWGHQNVTRYGMGDYTPQFFSRAKGGRVWDVDGKEYIDFMAGYGPIVLGPNDPDVEAAAQAQRETGVVFNGPSPILVEVSKYVVDLIPHADWVLFSKNGTDATTQCVTIARSATKKRKVLMAKGAYHGAVPWCSPSLVGVTAEDRAHIVLYDFNDHTSLLAAAKPHLSDLACVLVSAFKHDLGRTHEMPAAAFLQAARKLCDDTGAALICDEVRAGMRIHMQGTWEVVEGHGVRPDLAAWSKAVANGYPLAFVTGNNKFRKGAANIYATGSFWTESASLAAGLATMKKLVRIDGPRRMHELGTKLRDGINEQARKWGVPIEQSGPPQMPVILFPDDKFGKWERGHVFVKEAMKRGVYMHPTHTMFVNVCLTDKDIEDALKVTDAALEVVAKQFGYRSSL